MASYKHSCIHCGAMIASAARFCPKCGSISPFALRCPSCLKEVSKGDLLCAGCGRPLVIPCPQCGKDTFLLEKCEVCAASLMVKCPNQRCEEMVFFQNTHCRACGQKIKK